MAAKKKRSTKGYTLFWRATKRRWVMSSPDPVTGEWKQHTLPEEIGERDEAKAKRYVLARLDERGDVPARKRASGPTLAEVARPWIDLRLRAVKEGQLAPATVRDNDGHLRKHVLPTFGTRMVSQLVDDIPALRAWLRDVRTKVAPSRCSNILNTFRTLLDDAKAEGWVPKFGDNPLRLPAIVRELPELHGNREPIIIPRNVARALIEAPNDVVPLNRRVRYCVAIAGGLPDGEIAGLSWRDVQFDEPTPYLNVRVAARLIGDVELVDDGGRKRVKGKSQGNLGDTKNQYRVRKVPLHPASIAALKEWRETGAAALLGREPLPTDPVFPGRGGSFSRPSSAKHLRNDIVAALLFARGFRTRGALRHGELPVPPHVRAEAEAVAEPITFHGTRRTFLTWLDEAGASDAVRKRLAGHSRGSVTEAHYTARELAKLAEAVRLLDLTWPSRDTAGHQETPADPDTVSPAVSATQSATPSDPESVTEDQESGPICATPSEPTMGFEPTTCGLRSREAEGSGSVSADQDATGEAPEPPSTSGGEGPRGSRNRVSRARKAPRHQAGNPRSVIAVRSVQGVSPGPVPATLGGLIDDALELGSERFGDVLDDAIGGRS